jgi:protein-S-isoprenylcysteine O-methyltransferase Ste14
MIPLSCSEQPRFDLGPLNLALGGSIFIIGLVFLSSILRINPWPTPDSELTLVTSGMYSLVRNPIYLGEILWSLGWAIAFGSVIGVLLVPLWWTGFLFHVILEEEDLEDRLNGPYLRYKRRVRGRILPGLPF